MSVFASIAKQVMASATHSLLPALPVPLVIGIASKLARTRPLAKFPDWRFAIEESNPTTLVKIRRRLWQYFREAGIECPVRVKWHHGLQLDLVLGNDQSRCLYVGGSFEPNEFAFLEKILCPGMLVLDVGANEGFYTVYMANRVAPEGFVVAVEPSPRERSRLENNVSINRLQNVRIVSSGLAAETGRAMLHIADPEHNGQNTLGHFVYEGVAETCSIEIELESLDSLVERLSLPRVDLIKMDVEGAEMRVLCGARALLRDSKPVILFELLDPALRAQGASAQAVIDFLTDLGYRLLTFRYDGEVRPLEGLQGASSNLVAMPEVKDDGWAARTPWGTQSGV